MDNIKISAEQISAVQFDKSVVCNVKKQITTVPIIDKNGTVENEKLEYGLQFNVNGTGLKHILNMATLNSKTDIGNNFRSRCKKDVDAGHNDTFEFFNSMLNDEHILIVSGFPTSLPDAPETPEQRKRTIIAQWTIMDEKERAELIESLQAEQ